MSILPGIPVILTLTGIPGIMDGHEDSSTQQRIFREY